MEKMILFGKSMLSGAKGSTNHLFYDNACC